MNFLEKAEYTILSNFIARDFKNDPYFGVSKDQWHYYIPFAAVIYVNAISIVILQKMFFQVFDRISSKPLKGIAIALTLPLTLPGLAFDKILKYFSDDDFDVQGAVNSFVVSRFWIANFFPILGSLFLLYTDYATKNRASFIPLRLNYSSPFEAQEIIQAAPTMEKKQLYVLTFLKTTEAKLLDSSWSNQTLEFITLCIKERKIHFSDAIIKKWIESLKESGLSHDELKKDILEVPNIQDILSRDKDYKKILSGCERLELSTELALDSWIDKKDLINHYSLWVNHDIDSSRYSDEFEKLKAEYNLKSRFEAFFILQGKSNSQLEWKPFFPPPSIEMVKALKALTLSHIDACNWKKNLLDPNIIKCQDLLIEIHLVFHPEMELYFNALKKAFPSSEATAKNLYAMIHFSTPLPTQEENIECYKKAFKALYPSKGVLTNKDTDIIRFLHKGFENVLENRVREFLDFLEEENLKECEIIEISKIITDAFYCYRESEIIWNIKNVYLTSINICDPSLLKNLSEDALNVLNKALFSSRLEGAFWNNFCAYASNLNDEQKTTILDGLIKDRYGLSIKIEYQKEKAAKIKSKILNSEIVADQLAPLASKIREARNQLNDQKKVLSSSKVSEKTICKSLQKIRAEPGLRFFANPDEDEALFERNLVTLLADFAPHLTPEGRVLFEDYFISIQHSRHAAIVPGIFLWLEDRVFDVYRPLLRAPLSEAVDQARAQIELAAYEEFEATLKSLKNLLPDWKVKAFWNKLGAEEQRSFKKRFGRFYTLLSYGRDPQLFAKNLAFLLDEANADESLAEKLMVLIDEGQDSCTDRALFQFDTFINTTLPFIKNKDDPEKMIAAMKSSFVITSLIRYVQRHASEWGSYDPIEDALYILHHDGPRFGLSFSGAQMTFTHSVRVSSAIREKWIIPEIKRLLDQKDKIIEQLLLNRFWVDFLNRRYKDEITDLSSDGDAQEEKLAELDREYSDTLQELKGIMKIANPSARFKELASFNETPRRKKYLDLCKAIRATESSAENLTQAFYKQKTEELYDAAHRK